MKSGNTPIIPKYELRNNKVRFSVCVASFVKNTEEPQKQLLQKERTFSICSILLVHTYIHTYLERRRIDIDIHYTLHEMLP
jgi:hypothetical protein